MSSIAKFLFAAAVALCLATNCSQVNQPQQETVRDRPLGHYAKGE